MRKECKRSSQRTTSIVTEIIQSLLISDHVLAHDSSFFTKALQKLLTLINEASIKQVHRDAMKRESIEVLFKNDIPAISTLIALFIRCT